MSREVWSALLPACGRNAACAGRRRGRRVLLRRRGQPGHQLSAGHPAGKDRRTARPVRGAARHGGRAGGRCAGDHLGGQRADRAPAEGRRGRHHWVQRVQPGRAARAGRAGGGADRPAPQGRAAGRDSRAMGGRGLPGHHNWQHPAGRRAGRRARRAGALPGAAGYGPGPARPAAGRPALGRLAGGSHPPGRRGTRRDHPPAARPPPRRAGGLGGAARRGGGQRADGTLSHLARRALRRAADRHRRGGAGRSDQPAERGGRRVPGRAWPWRGHAEHHAEQQHAERDGRAAAARHHHRARAVGAFGAHRGLVPRADRALDGVHLP